MDSPQNVNIQCDQVLQLVDTFNSQRHDQLDDDQLFYDHLRKCRCCFMQLTEIRGSNIIHQWHRETFMAMTGLELSSESQYSNYLCLNCFELLKIFSQMKVATDGIRNVQKNHRELFDDVTVKQEVNKGTINITGFDLTEPKIEAMDASDVTLIIDDDDDDDETLQPDMNSTLLPDNNHNEIVNVPVAAFDQQIDELDIEDIVEAKKDNIIATALHTSVRTSSDVHADQSKSVNPLSCDVCGYESDNKGLLAFHMISRHKETDKQPENEFKCPMDGCSKVCKDKSLLYRHLYRWHDGLREEITCNQCGKVFKCKMALRQHQKVHNKKFECKICNKLLAHKHQLIDHIETYHIENNKVACTKCSKIFKSQLKLKMHQRVIHDGKKFKCDKCDAAFSLLSYLCNHVKVKHEGKRYRCPHSGCSNKFTSRSSAATHLRQLHMVDDDEYKHYSKLLTIS